MPAFQDSLSSPTTLATIVPYKISTHSEEQHAISVLIFACGASAIQKQESVMLAKMDMPSAQS